MAKLKDLIKLCENEIYIYYFKKHNKLLFFRGEKHNGKVWQIEPISFNVVMLEIEFKPKIN
jgi:hypothetical protein